ncbi:YifB family Mg chelatase-like AAA ATPase [Corynebacterium spheniscorum]|uniref:Magnesium chelatase family protein n=1 Tax=Corynebacterium spheniscorum TaxID=185761 RepID=A0A1I2RDP5_9CORY|nr:YifB family Mg chelatase-like AAA ATPase [Corynebacterium spheniscorum]KAA8722578.1 YifB family Mg chelatase-like AAA ATPase [Corynebacterium spheniscorum]SFG36737.1 magnesium chelatase family protein [Corynebacterium spheniscorum]
MALAKTHSVALEGVSALPVLVEANIGPGLPGFYMVGLADTAVSESRDRIRTAIRNLDLDWPRSKITISLSPGSLRKAGSHFDAAIALAVLCAHCGQAEPYRVLANTMMLGEIGLDGSLRGVPGILPALIMAKQQGLRCIVPSENQAEAALMEGLEIYHAANLMQLWNWLNGVPLPTPKGESPQEPHIPDMADLAGQDEAKYAAEVAAAGGHHMVIIGPPGSGKSMLAQRLPGILPPLNREQAIATTSVHSVAEDGFHGSIHHAPFIAPHHSISRAGLLGGGSGRVRPGAVSLAHNGVLFLDEISEIPARILDSLRMPLEQRHVRLLRARREIILPANFQLILAANPCRCGAEEAQECECTSRQRATYLDNLSGPMRDRLDIHLRTTGHGAVLNSEAESSASIATRVAAARERSIARWGVLNSHMDPHILRKKWPADDAGMALLGVYLAEGRITQRGVDRILSLAWTLCDLEDIKRPQLDHIARALELGEDLT